MSDIAMSEAELEIERERLKLAKEQLRFERLKERNASIRFFLGILVVGVVTWAINAAISVEQGRRALIQSERALILPQVIDIHKVPYDEQQQKLRVLRTANLSPEVQSFLRVLESIVEEKHRADLKVAEAERLKAEAEANQRAAEVAAFAQAAAKAEAEKQRQLLEALSRSNLGMSSETAGPW